MRDRSYSRRRTVAGLGSVLAVGVAGCSGENSDDDIAFDHPEDVRLDKPFDLTVVSIVGSGLVWEGGATATNLPETSSWSLEGEPVPYVPYDDGAAEEGLSGREFFESSLETASAEAIDDATIPVAEIDGDVVLVSGGDDELWPTARLHEIAVERLESNDHSAFEHLVYEAAGHGIFPPYRPVRGTTGEGVGGSLAGNARAAHEHWPHVLEAFSTLE